jgi:cerevisin
LLATCISFFSLIYSHAKKVLDNSGSGYNSDIIAGIDYVVRAHDNSGRNSIISMSVGGAGESQSMDDAIQNAWNNGVFCVGM